MVEIIGTNITCALGSNTDETFGNLRRGNCGLTFHSGSALGVTDDYMASVVDVESLPKHSDVPATKLEHMTIHSIADALSQCTIDTSTERTLFVFSSTKGNITLLSGNNNEIPSKRVYLPETARFIASHFNIKTAPVVVSNACISGLSALILAQRLLENGTYDNAIITGADIISRFTVSGFQSFKALSNKCCKPFDANREGLNLGEAAATIIMKRTDIRNNSWYIERGMMHNDANHISGPSRVGEGSYRCLNAITANVDREDIALINAHGTATPYNDEMESIAIDRAGLSTVPVNCYKGYLGHTLGAAGVLECIISMKSIDNGELLPTLGYETCGVSHPLNIVTDHTKATGNSFIKMLSGFGGCNAAALFRKEVKQ